MRRNKSRQLLGIDINQTEICVTQLQGAWPDPTVLKIDSEPMPHNSMKNGIVTNPDMVAEALRGLLERMEVSTRNAVISIAARQVATRVLDIPNVPDNEVKTLIEMEVNHQHILRDDNGLFAHIGLASAIKGRDDSRQILVMAAEDSTLAPLRELAHKSGVVIQGLEPSMMANMRIASLTTHTRQSALCIAMGTSESDISIVEHGNIRLYRRVDTGSHQLMSPPKGGVDRKEDGTIVREKMRMTAPIDEEPAVESETVKLGFDMMAANTLTLEVQRSLDYYKRECPDAGIVSSVTLVCNRPELESFARWISQSLQLEVVIAGIRTESQPQFSLLHLLQPPNSMRYLTSLGLAMRALTNVPETIPLMDLSGDVIMEREEVQTRNKLTFSLVASVAILMGGMVASFMVGSKVNRAGVELASLKQDMDRMQKMKNVKLEEMQRQRDLMVRLKVEGLPIPRVLDVITAAVPPNVGILDISVAKSGTITISGEATNDREIIALLESLKREPLLKSTSLDSFDSSNASPNGEKQKIVKFQVSAQLAGVIKPDDVEAIQNGTAPTSAPAAGQETKIST